MKVRWTRRALRLLEEVRSYIQRDNPAAAERTSLRLEAAASRLGDFPWMGREGKLSGTRELAIPQTPLLLVYRVEPEQVTILGIFHGAQDWQLRS